jgi:lysozyme family protein
VKGNFETALKHVLIDEGGYVNHPKDPGGETNYGITKRTARAHGYTGSMRSIPMSVVRTIYRKSYWDRVNGDALPAGVDYAVFDFAVNSGPGRAIPFLQRAVGVPSDGQIGPVTLDAVTRKGSEAVIKRLCQSRLAWLKKLKTWRTFGRGWERRVVAVERDALAMARAAQLLPIESHAPLQGPQTEPDSTPKRNWFLS